MKDLSNYTIELQAESKAEHIPLLTTTAETSIQFWYDALTGQNSRTVYFFFDDPNHGFEDLISFMKDSDIKYFAIRYDSVIFVDNMFF